MWSESRNFESMLDSILDIRKKKQQQQDFSGGEA